MEHKVTIDTYEKNGVEVYRHVDRDYGYPEQEKEKRTSAEPPTSPLFRKLIGS